jgi:hypothetical protein
MILVVASCDAPHSDRFLEIEYLLSKQKQSSL